MKKYLKYISIVIALITNSTLNADDNFHKFTAKQKKGVSFIYKWYTKPIRFTLTSNKFASICAGLFADSSLSSYLIPGFIKKYSLSVDEFELPVSSFKTFNDFFTRKLKPHARKIDSKPHTIVSPADGAIIVIDKISPKTEFPIKGTNLSIEKVLNDKELAERYLGGCAFVIRLAPWDYHRFHSPTDGHFADFKIIKGKLESVHPHVYSLGIQPLEVNERHLISCQTNNFGLITFMPVGALFVGSIKYTYKPNQKLNKGSELGYFLFGGSTVVLFFEKDKINVDKAIIDNSKAGKETPIKMGQTIALIDKSRTK